MRERNFRDLPAWQEAMRLVQDVYGATRGWPGDEQRGLTADARGAAVTVPAKIAGGYGLSSIEHRLHYFTLADGSLREVETYLELGLHFGYLDRDTHAALVAQAERVDGLLDELIRRVRPIIGPN